MFYITDDRPEGYVVLSTAAQWVRWLWRNIPDTLHRDVQMRLSSNLKHLLVGMELKAALVEGHEQFRHEHSLLFESYFQNFISEFCVATFSVFEGLGAAHWLAQNGQDGTNGPPINRNQWRPVLRAVYDENGEYGLDDNVEVTQAVRDKLHQDRLGARENIDWHDFDYEAAFIPARRAIATLPSSRGRLCTEVHQSPLTLRRPRPLTCSVIHGYFENWRQPEGQNSHSCGRGCADLGYRSFGQSADTGSMFVTILAGSIPSARAKSANSTTSNLRSPSSTLDTNCLCKPRRLPNSC